MERVTFLLATIALVFAEPPVLQTQYGAPGGYSSGSYSSGGHSSGGYSSGGYSSNGYSSNGYSGSGSSQGYPGGSSQFGSGFGNGQVSTRDVPMFTHEQNFQQSPGSIWGKWSVVLPDGRTQRVEYDADENGFHPIVTFEDPRDGVFGGAGSGGYSNGGSSGNKGYNY